jgi:2-keto-4-pentenoate hydratase/2-oxohepta-3-ene-1,7-dioic acid hydratase in catechol pathway
MKWLRFLHEGIPAFGRIDAVDSVRVFRGDMFNQPESTSTVLPLEGLKFLAPCQPSKMFALWNNFAAAATKNGWATPDEPLYFMKPANTFAGHESVVSKPASYVGRVLYEAELGVVIGKEGKNIALEDASKHIFGYTCINDVTALEVLRSDASFEQWTRAKGFDGFAPFGPFIETEIDPAHLHVKAVVNGRERQNYPVADMFFSPAQLVSRLSRDVTLLPGDVISCGTSSGAGPWQLDTQVQIVIEGVGTLSNKYL